MYLERSPAWLVLALASAGCGPECPAQPTACDAPLTLLVPLEAGEPQVYEISLKLRTGNEEATDRCLAILPPPADWTANVPVTCLRNAASLYIERDLQIDCSASYPEGVSCTSEVGDFVLKLRGYGRVDAVELQLSRGETTFTPVEIPAEYETYHPDGPSCPASCEVMTRVVSFDSLVQSSS